MKTKTRGLFLLFTLMVAVGLSVDVLFTHAGTLQPQGTSITVGTTEDTLSGSDCSLRAAIQSANTDSAVGGCPAGNGRDTILLAAETYTLGIANLLLDDYVDEDAANTGDLDITQDLVIRGKGRSATLVSANLIDRVFHIDPSENSISVNIYNLAVLDGKAFEEDKKGGGGVLTSGALFLKGVRVSNNESQRGGGIRITHSGSLAILDSVVEVNTASEQGGGLYGDAPISLENVQIMENKAPVGGGLFCDRSCELRDVTISQNKALGGNGRGGGVYIDYPAEFVNVTVDNNWAGELGGGIYSQAELHLINATISKNLSDSGGSAIFSNAPVDLTNVTIFGNETLTDAGLVIDPAGTLNIVNSIIANNQPKNCDGDFKSYGNNISSDDTCDLTHDNDLIDLDPLLDVLEENGGKTQTHALNSNSPAIDAGNNDLCASTDQRGIPRPVDGDLNGKARCDIGAHENVPAGVLMIEPVAYAVEEDIGSFSVPVIRSDGSVGAVSVYYMTSQKAGINKAHRDADYIHIFGQLNWADGDNSTKYLLVDIVDEQSYEPDEFFDVILADPDGGVAIGDGGRKAFITILENDHGYPPATPVPEPDQVSLPLVADP